MGKAAKFWVAVIGGAATTAVSLFEADSTVGKVLTVIVAACTAAAVYLTPNAPPLVDEKH